MYRRTAIALIAAVAISACSDSTAPKQLASRENGLSFKQDPSEVVEHVNEHFEILYFQENPCTGELIQFLGRYHVNGTITTTSEGEESKLHLNTEDFQGVGLITGLKYLYHQQTQQTDEFTYNPVTEQLEYRVSYDVISQGSTDNFHGDLHYVFTYPPGNFEIIRDDARCTG